MTNLNNSPPLNTFFNSKEEKNLELPFWNFQVHFLLLTEFKFPQAGDPMGSREFHMWDRAPRAPTC